MRQADLLRYSSRLLLWSINEQFFWHLPLSQDGRWTILEPIMYVEVVVPEENQGTVMTMMSRRDGVIIGSDGADGWVTLEVEAPLNRVCM